jgi:hypothetical protein
MRRIPIVLGLVLAAASAGAARAEEQPYSPARADRVRALAERVAREVVRIEVEREAAPDSLVPPARYDGGGFHVGAGLIVTSHFFLEGAREIRVRLPDGKVAPARVHKRVPRLGLALLDVPAAKGLPVPEIASRKPPPVLGSTLFLALPGDGSAAPAVGYGHWLEVPGTAFYGRASFVARNGHPLFDPWGKVAGVTAFAAKVGLGTLIIPAWAIRELLGRPLDDAPADGSEG